MMPTNNNMLTECEAERLWMRCSSNQSDAARADAMTSFDQMNVLDIDDSVDVVHGCQQLSLFNAYYDERCFLPIHVYDTERSRPVAMILRSGKTPSGVEIRSHLRRLVRRIRRRWPTTRTMRNEASCLAEPNTCKPQTRKSAGD